VTSQRRTPSGQGPSRRPGASRVRTTGSTRLTGSHTRARPGSARRTAAVGNGPAKRTAAPRPPRGLTGRATVVIVVFVALALAYTYPLRVYLAQQSQIAQLERERAEKLQSIAETSAELQKWKDREYIVSQARERLLYVRPGDTPLLVLNDPDRAARETGMKPTAAAPDRWYDTLWNSVRAADAESPN
jgi:cell division protein FtsB